MWKWLLIIAASLIGLVVLTALVGMFLPKGHRASRTVTFPAPPAAVFATITDVARYPEWRTDVTKVEVMPDDGNGLLFREYGKQGAIAMRVEASERDSRLLVRIADSSLPFGGTWTYILKPAGKGTELTITEDGEIYNPIFRVMSKIVFSPYATIDAYMEGLRKRLA